jgi:hypothetical protein
MLGTIIVQAGTVSFHIPSTSFDNHLDMSRHANDTLSLSLAPQPSLGLGHVRYLLPLKMAEFLGGFSTIFFFTG